MNLALLCIKKCILRVVLTCSEDVIPRTTSLDIISTVLYIKKGEVPKVYSDITKVKNLSTYYKFVA